MQWLTSLVVVTIVVVPPTPGPHVPFDVTGNVVQHVATDLYHGQCTDRTTDWSWVHEILCHTRTWRFDATCKDCNNESEQNNHDQQQHDQHQHHQQHQQ
jgi:hypothetical protein